MLGTMVRNNDNIDSIANNRNTTPSRTLTTFEAIQVASLFVWSFGIPQAGCCWWLDKVRVIEHILIHRWRTHIPNKRSFEQNKTKQHSIKSQPGLPHAVDVGVLHHIFDLFDLSNHHLGEDWSQLEKRSMEGLDNVHQPSLQQLTSQSFYQAGTFGSQLGSLALAGYFLYRHKVLREPGGIFIKATPYVYSPFTL